MRENLELKLKNYAASGAYPFHMPGHKRVMDPLGCDAVKIDITEIDGFDNLHDAQEVLRDEMEAAAEMYGAKETIFSVNGSTCALLAAISAAVPRGGTILIERACHMAVYHAAYLRELKVLYAEEVCPEQCGGGISQGTGCARGSRNEQRTGCAWESRNEQGTGYARESRNEQGTGCTRESRNEQGTEGARDVGKNFDAVVITSPTYEGCVKDVGAWAEFAHLHDAVLLVDEAHGAHLGFHPYFPESAVRCGADVVVQSTHKTLPAMTQTALLHNVTGRVASRRLHFFMDIYETSSPSYVLMASITGALRMVRERGDVLFGNYAARLRKIRRELCSLKHFRLAGGEDAVIAWAGELGKYPVGTRMDPGKLVLVPTVRTNPCEPLQMPTARTNPCEPLQMPTVQTDPCEPLQMPTARKHSSKPPQMPTARKHSSKPPQMPAADFRYGAEWLYGVLRDEYHLQMEMRTAEYCLAMTSPADTEEGFERLANAMREIDAQAEKELRAADCGADGFRAAENVGKIFNDSCENVREPVKYRVPVVRSGTGDCLKISEALDAAFEMAAPEEAVGRVCADFVILYPPDVPLIVPGEIYTAEKAEEIRMWIEKGFSVMGVDVSRTVPNDCEKSSRKNRPQCPLKYQSEEPSPTSAPTAEKKQPEDVSPNNNVDNLC